MLNTATRSCQLLHSQLPHCIAIQAVARASVRHSFATRWCHAATRLQPATLAAMTGEGAPAVQEAFFGPGSAELRGQSCGGDCSRKVRSCSGDEGSVRVWAGCGGRGLDRSWRLSTHWQWTMVDKQHAHIRDTPRLTDGELDEALRALPAWQAAADRTSITRSFVAKNFVEDLEDENIELAKPIMASLEAIRFFGCVAEVAESEGHHPDLHLTNFRDVSVTVSTHAVGGLTRPDVILAAKLDAVPVAYSPKWLRENTPPA